MPTNDACPGDAQALAAVAVALSRENVETKDDAETLAIFGHDESDLGDFPPGLVAFARSTADVQAVLRACGQHRVPVTPVGARTGKSGGSLPVHGGVALSLERMNRILNLEPADLTAVVQPGVITGVFARAAEDAGLFYPPDPNSLDSCTLGGNVAENAGGPRALKYGVTRDYVLGLEWVLPTGEALRVGHRTMKGVAGYDLVGLFVGSEGTLGVATELTLKLLPLPRAVATALVPFRSVSDAAEAVTRVLLSGVLPRALELFDDVAISALGKWPRSADFSFPPACAAALIVELDGSREDSVLAELVEVGELCTKHGALDVLVAQSRSQRERIWQVRREVSPALRALQGHKLSEDVVVPRSRVPEAIARFKELGRELGLTLATYGHAGDGNLHTNILFSTSAQRPQVDLAIERLLRATVALGGTITGEHGVGLAKRGYLALEQTEALMQFQRGLKVLCDPLCTLNPGKLLPDPQEPS